MATFIVTTTNDGGAGSLRQAVLDANAAAGADEIRFDAGVFDGEDADLIRLTGGQIAITDDLTIVGGPAGVTITGDANGDDVTLAGGITSVAASGDALLDDNSRIFDATAALTLDGLTLTGGRTMADRGDGGGAVRGSMVTLIDSTVRGNSTAGTNSDGGGVSGDRVTLTNSTVSGNSTAGDNSDGGGVFSGVYGEVTLTNSIVLGNATIFAGVDGDESAGYGARTGGNIVGGDLFDGADDLAGGKGRDRIDGGLGDDLMQGGGCPDRFVFVAGFGADEIEDFDADPQGGQDRLDLRGLGVSAETLAARVAIERPGEDTLITVLDHGSILCLGVPGEGANAIDQSDLLLVA